MRRYRAFALVALGLGVLVATGIPALVTTARADDGSAASRASLLPLVQPLWSDLTPAQQEVLAPFEPQWNSWSAQEKLTWVSLANKLPGMAPKAQERARARIREWAALTPEQRRTARQNYRLARRLPPEQRQAQWERYSELTPEQRSVLRISGTTSNTAARHAGARTGLAKEAAQPLSDLVRRNSDTHRRKQPAPLGF